MDIQIEVDNEQAATGCFWFQLCPKKSISHPKLMYGVGWSRGKPGERYASVILKSGKGLEAVDVVPMNAHWGKPPHYTLTNSL